ncbi:hypothetical protein [Pectobacterium wasabiae]|uniref:hypothetical protein n=1 Tax=Pectobacterium wasabiae TaxID=55208 RepID=UPI0020A1955D|nr:hypothetical protein [Pectobacterium wasabiae]
MRSLSDCPVVNPASFRFRPQKTHFGWDVQDRLVRVEPAGRVGNAGSAMGMRAGQFLSADVG